MTTPDTALLLHAVELAPDGALIVQTDGTIVYANRAMHELVGTDELVGRCVDDLVPGALRERHVELRDRFTVVPAQRPMGAGLELGLERVDGVILPVEISLSPFEHGQSYVVAAVRDITERRESQERLSVANEQLALVSERERIGRDLHDVVLQHLYGVGLSVQAIGTASAPETSDRLEGVIDEIDKIISEVRTIVFTLGTTGHHGALAQELTDVVAQASRVLGFTPSLRIDGPVESALTDEIRTEMVASMREALGNVARHAQASAAHVVVELAGDSVMMSVTDNGIGPPSDDATIRGGHGLASLQSRAETFGGSCTLDAAEPVGSRLCWSAPY